MVLQIYRQVLTLPKPRIPPLLLSRPVGMVLLGSLGHKKITDPLVKILKFRIICLWLVRKTM